MSSTQKKTVLIIEDDRALNEAYVMIIKSAGYEVGSAENGEEALAYLQAHGDPDMMFLDLRMPIMDGIEFLRRYKPAEHPGVKIIVFSNYDADAEVEQAYELGAERYILKARATPKELLKIVQSFVGK